MGEPRSRVEWLLEGVSLAAVVASAAMVAIRWRRLPARIPIHFGFSGAPNVWGGKGVLFILVGASLLVWILLSVAERYPGLVNLPFAVDRNSPDVGRILRSLSIMLKTAMALAFLWLTRRVIETALGTAQGIGIAFLPVFLALVLLTLILYTGRLRRFRK